MFLKPSLLLSQLQWFPKPSLPPYQPPLFHKPSQPPSQPQWLFLHPASSTLRMSWVSSASVTRTSTLPELSQRTPSESPEAATSMLMPTTLSRLSTTLLMMSTDSELPPPTSLLPLLLPQLVSQSPLRFQSPLLS